VTHPTSTSGPDAVFTDREFRFTRRDFRHITATLYADAGIALSEAKAPLVYGRLVKRLRALGMESFARYCALLDGEDGADERGRMTAALTTNVTRFFREPHHFADLRDRILPPLLEKVRAGGRLRIWSAGCSSGEEPYSIALTILAIMPDAHRFDVKVLGTDINTQMLSRGADGLYSEAALRPVAPSMRNRWFTPAADGAGAWRVGSALSALVTFRELNLTRPWPMSAAYQAIFCRNVLIYFGPEDRVEVWRRMAPLLTPGGRLYVGHSERIQGADDLFSLEGPTTYGRRVRPEASQEDEAAAARRPAPSRSDLEEAR
jgi:chemotaxis protein methyltransferase CheR